LVLSRSFMVNKIAGTYLFYGEDGIGRWQTAICFAALLNCEQPKIIDEEQKLAVPCRECRRCHNIFNLNFEGLQCAVPIPPHNNKLDKAIDFTNEVLAMKRKEPFRIIKAASSINIPIAVAREIKKTLSLKATQGIKRAVIFYQMEKMKTSSADALLKLIEEPPEDTVVILIASKPDALLPTIQSRSQKIKIDKNRPQDIENYLVKIYEMSPQRAKLLSKISKGSLGRAIDMIETTPGEAESKRAVIFLLFKSLFVDKSPDTLTHMNEVLNFRDRGEAEELLRLWQLLVRDGANFAVSNDANEIINIDFSVEIQNLAAYFSRPRLAPDMVEHIKNTLADLRRNVHIQGALMALALRLKSVIGTNR